MVLVATQVKRRRGTTAENDAFTGAQGEIVVDTERHELRVHDGVTQGGFIIPTTETILSHMPSNMDYVIESQEPTAENGYTWYRKYKSGWVEQGGIDTTSYVTFPIAMANTNYTVSCCMNNTNVNVGNPTIFYMDKTTTGIRILIRWDGAGTTGERCWQVSGISAQ